MFDSLTNRKRRKRLVHMSRSFTVIEILIDITIITLVATAILSLMVMNFRSAAYAQLKVVATNLANDRIETIRNLPYDEIATENGPILPQKNLKDSEELSYAGWNFTINTDARYFDDPYDHLATDPEPDTAPIDYKKVKITVYAEGHSNPLAEIATNIGSKAAETASNTGILLVKVVDNPAIGDQPISDASVHIINSTLSPVIDITGTTDSSGYLMVPELPPASNNSYQVTVTKNGYSTDITLPANYCSQSVTPSPSANLNPNISIQRVTAITMQIRCLTDVSINLVDSAGTPQPNMTVKIQSSRQLCTDPKYKYESWQTSDENGHIGLSQLEHDSYIFSTAEPPECPATCPATIISSTDDYQPSLCQTVNSIVVISNTPTFIILSDVSPRHPNSDFSGDMTIFGERLDLLASAKFVRTGEPDIIGTIVTQESSEALVTFNFASAANGSWDLIVTNIYGEVSYQHNAIEVTSN